MAKRASPRAVRKVLDELEVPEIYREPEIVEDKPRRGRPELPYTTKAANEFCSRMQAGEPMRDICATPGMPSWTTIWKWKTQRADFAAMYARAREGSAESCEHNAIEAALKAVDRDTAAAAMVQMNAWKWAAAKRNPRTHGDRIDANISGIIGVAKIPLDPAMLSEEQREVMQDVLLIQPPPQESGPYSDATDD